MNTDFLAEQVQGRLLQFNKAISEEGFLSYAPENIKKYAGELDIAFKKLTKARDELLKGLSEKDLRQPINFYIGLEEYQYAMLATTITMFLQEKSIPYETLQPYVESRGTRYMPKVDAGSFLQAVLDANEDQQKNGSWDGQKVALWMVQTINGIAENPVKYRYENLFQKCYAILLIISAAKLNIRICKQCEKPFITKDPRIRYCSQECKLKQKQQAMQLKRSGIYAEREAIRNIYRKRETFEYGQNKAISKKEYEQFEQKLLEKLRKGEISEEECLEKFKEMHKKIVQKNC